MWFHTHMECVMHVVLTMLTIGSYFNLWTHFAMCINMRLYRWHWVVWHIKRHQCHWSTLSPSSGSYLLFIRLNFACHCNPFFDIFISLEWKKKKFYITFDGTKNLIGIFSHLCVGFALNGIRYSFQKTQKRVSITTDNLFIKLLR